MFDANLRHLPKGVKFFAKVDYITPSSRLWGCGVRGGDLIKCEMVDDTHFNPRVSMELNGVSVIVQAEKDSDHYENFIVFEGRQDGRSFINRDSYNKANEMMGGVMEVGFSE